MSAETMPTITTTANEAPVRGTGRARVFAAFALASLVLGVGYAASQGYRAATDGFVAPAILSPESDIVLQTKAKMSELEVERNRMTAEAESIDADLAAADRAIARLKSLQSTLGTSLDWTKAVSAQRAAASYSEMRTLANQRAVLRAMLEKQSSIAADATANLNASLISKHDASKERLAFDQVQLAILENDRARVQSEAALNAAYFAQKALAGTSTTMMPEAVAREEQLVHLELEVARLESEQRTKRAAKSVVLAKLAKMDELEAQLRGRPLFRATQQSLEVAFVPYTQSDSVAPGSTVLDCTWSIFNCRPVGTVAEMIPGEVILPDPWGNPARGQYAVLGLTEHESAKSKVLRVRGAASQRQRADSGGAVVSAR